jgi:nucleoside-diphosphate-sugar epimerase
LNILVIGGTHFVGPHLVAQLDRMGYSVTVFHRGETETELPKNVKHIHGDRNILDKKLEELKRASPDIVIDTGLYNEQQAAKVTQAFKGIAKRIIVLSSMDVYRAYGLLLGIEQGPKQSVPIKEDDSLRHKLYPYQEKIGNEWARQYDKILVERAIQRNPELHCTILRLPMVYGPMDFQHRLLYWLKPMKIDKRKVILSGEKNALQRASRGYVENIAYAIALAVSNNKSANRIYNIADEPALTTLEWGQSIAEMIGWSGKIMTVPDERLPASLRGIGQDWVVDTARIREELGFNEIVPFREGLSKTIEWELSNIPKELSTFQLVDYKVEDNIVKELNLQ